MRLLHEDADGLGGGAADGEAGLEDVGAGAKGPARRIVAGDGFPGAAVDIPHNLRHGRVHDGLQGQGGLLRGGFGIAEDFPALSEEHVRAAIAFAAAAARDDMPMPALAGSR
jgi:hypothetical protein